MQRLVHAGRVCPEDAQLASLGVLPGSLLDLSVRLRGGGGDGGSTGAESRASYLEMYATKKKEKVRFTPLYSYYIIRAHFCTLTVFHVMMLLFR